MEEGVGDILIRSPVYPIFHLLKGDFRRLYRFTCQVPCYFVEGTDFDQKFLCNLRLCDHQEDALVGI